MLLTADVVAATDCIHV